MTTKFNVTIEVSDEELATLSYLKDKTSEAVKFNSLVEAIANEAFTNHLVKLNEEQAWEASGDSLEATDEDEVADDNERSYGPKQAFFLNETDGGQR